MEIEILNYKEKRKIVDKLYAEDIRGSCRRELNELDDSSLINEFKRSYARETIFENTTRRLKDLVEKKNPICRYTCLRNKRFKALALKNFEEDGRNTLRYLGAFGIAVYVRGIDQFILFDSDKPTRTVLNSQTVVPLAISSFSQ